MNDAPLGIFDSGVGGLTVARSILDQLPHESTLYIGDTLNTPYGTKPLAAVRAHALEVMDDLVDAGVKLLVIACNTASSAMLRDARERYTLRRGIPVVEVILPAARRAVAATRTGRIGVIATKSTVESRSYDDAFAVAPGRRADDAGVPASSSSSSRRASRPAPRSSRVAHEYLDPVRAAGVDTLVLGCTHYPLLTGAISYVMGEEVTLVSSAEETAKDVYRTLVAHDLERDPAAGPPEPPVPGHGRPGRSSAPSRAGSSAPRSRPSSPARPCGEAHRPGLRGLVPGPGLGGVGLPGAGRGRRRSHLDGPARPRQRCARRAAAVRRPDRGSTRSALSHLHADHVADLAVLNVLRRYRPGRPAARRSPCTARSGRPSGSRSCPARTPRPAPTSQFDVVGVAGGRPPWSSGR